MSWLTTYLAVAAIVAAGCFLGAQWIRDQRIPTPDRPALVALAAGACWPLVVAGGVQLALVVALQRLLSGHDAMVVRRRLSSLACDHAER